MAFPQRLSGHLWSATILAVSATIALVADRVSAAGQTVTAAGAGVDISGYVGLSARDTAQPRLQVPVAVDPFDSRAVIADDLGVASPSPVPTVPSSAPRRGLTAILIADERRVAVIDDVAVTVGEVLQDGSRVSEIQPDRVFVVEKNGRLRMLTLSIGDGR